MKFNPSQKAIFQVITYRTGERSPAICCNHGQFVDSVVKVYANTVDLEGNKLEHPDLSPLKEYGLLLIAEVHPDDSSIIDQRGVSRAPIMRLDRFCHMALNPDVPFEG